MPPSRREHLLDTALDLFSRHGFHATGIDTILAEAGVAKMTLYNHFKSKDELILAALRLRDERWRRFFERAVERAATTAAGRLIAIFDILEGSFGADFNGCLFTHASAEFADHDNPIHGAAGEHKRLTHRYIRRLAAEAGAADADELASQLCLLIDGALVAAQVSGSDASARHARTAAALLVEQAIGGTDAVE